MAQSRLAEREQVKYLSNKSIHENNNHPLDWQPLIPEQERSYQIAMSKNKNPKILDEKPLFKPLYEGNDKKGTNDHFELMYKFKKQAVSASRSEPDLPGDINMETGSNSLETIQQNKMEQIQKEAYEKGFSHGKKEGYEAGILEARQIVENLTRIMVSIEDLWQRMVVKYENDIIELVKRISEKVIYGNAQIDNEIVKRAILKSFELIPEPTEATINVSVEDYDFIESAKEDLFEKIKSLKKVSIVSDPSLARGGCRIETKTGEVDSDIQSRLNAISKSIIEAASEMADDQ
jgi:flagellar biosynthesis/type III secretory pathway protein FliH